MLLLVPAAAGAQEDASTPVDSASRGPIRLGLKEIAPPFQISFPGAPGLNMLALRPRFTDWTREWSRDVRARAERRRGELWREASSRPALEAAFALAAADSLIDAPEAPRALLPEAVAEYAELGMRVTGRGEMGGAWNRFKPCTYSAMVDCNPSLFPRLKPDVQFGVQVGGTISDRIHVDVDYDQRREFDAANNINVFYQGLEDEVIQRLEVGDVSIQLPQSRYITQGIPAGNFGFKATGELGPMTFQSVWAQQKGDISNREFRLGGGGSTQRLEQEMQKVFDDADYQQGQFFFLVDPDSLEKTPHIDILALQSGDAPVRLRPDGNTLLVYREEAAGLTHQSTGAELADAFSQDRSITHTGRYRQLTPGEDYYVDTRSGLWLMLRAPLRGDEAIAVRYVTQSGDSVGRPARGADKMRLRLLRGPVAKHQPGTATWKYEMHQVYRLDSNTGVDLNSLDLEISKGDLARGETFRTVAGQQVPYIRFFGLDESPQDNRLDAPKIFQPGANSMEKNPRIGGTFIVFPTLRPFAAPAPAAGFTPEQLAQSLASDSNRVIYDEPEPQLRYGSPRFRLTAGYRVRVEGLMESFSLGTLGIREGSEKILVDGKALMRGVDYEIDYDLGSVMLKDAQSVFGTNPNAEIRATWEQQSLFQIAPTSVFGMNADFQLGSRGKLSFLGLYQAEKSLMTRPQLGVEPGSIMLGGVSGRFDIGAGWLDRGLEAIPGLRLASQSTIQLTGEMAMSVPTPNTRGATYLDDFEASDEQSLRLDRRAWRLGSKPDVTPSVFDILPTQLSPETAGRLIWQHDYQIGGQIVAGVPTDYIDTQIRTTNSGVSTEQQLFFFFEKEPTSAPDQRLWRSITTALSTTGLDLSRSEFLEVYIASRDEQELKLILDIGEVGEDGFYFDSAGATRGRYSDGRTWGEGVLDEEAKEELGEIWGDEADRRGLWDQPCQSAPGQTFAPADARANCARTNGVPDTEDLNLNRVLDAADGSFFRYIVPLGSLSKYVIRDQRATGTDYRLYRIPLRDLSLAEPVNGANSSTWRFVKHLRLTVTGKPAVIDRAVPMPTMKLARMRVVGSRWIKRGTSGFVTGLVGDTTGFASGDFRVGPVGRLNEPRYVSPPGIGDEAQNATSGLGGQNEEINEKSLRLQYEGLSGNQRAEVYYRYPQQPRSLMSYRDMRLWAVPAAGTWGPNSPQWLVVKVATDARNYYLYRTRLQQPATYERIEQSDWTETTIDFNRWFDLKAEAEQRLIVEGAPQMGQVMQQWSADSAYAIVLEDRARAPNLAAVREISFAVYNADGLPVAGEVWLDEMRLGSPMTDPGAAGNMRLDVRGGDFLSASIAYSDRGAVFQQLKDEAGYQRAGDLHLSTRAEMGRFAPAGWGIDMPVEIAHSRSGTDPQFLDRSDVRADRLSGLRESGGEQTRFGVSLRKRTPTANPWLSLLVDGTALHMNVINAEASAITSRNESSTMSGGLNYSRQVSERVLDVVPMFLESALRAVFPGKLEETDFFRRLAGAALRWTPEAIGFGSTYNSVESRSYNFDRILALPTDSAIKPIESPREGLENSANLTLRPFESLRATVTVSSTRNLLESERATTREQERQAIDGARSRLGGMDLGWEAQRSLASQFSWTPTIGKWIRPSVSYTSRFGADRTSSYFELVDAAGDSIPMLQRGFQANRQLVRSLQIDPAALVVATLGMPDSAMGFTERAARGAGKAIQRLELTWESSLGSQFERELSTPGFGYQLGLGDMSSFRYLDGDTARVTNLRDSFRARGGLKLPVGADLTLGYAASDGDVLDLGGGRRTVAEKRWPEARLSWSGLPIPSMLRPYIAQAGVSAGIDLTRRSDVVGGRSTEGAGEGPLVGGRERGSQQTDVPLQFQLASPIGISASYTGTIGTGTITDPAGDSELDKSQHSVQLSGVFKAPKALRERFPAPFQGSLRYSLGNNSECRYRSRTSSTVSGIGTGGSADGSGDPAASTAPECVPFLDNTTRTLSFSLDTVLRELTVGVQASYNDNQRSTGTRDGASQFQLGIFGQFNFEAGRFPDPRGF